MVALMTWLHLCLFIALVVLSIQNALWLKVFVKSKCNNYTGPQARITHTKILLKFLIRVNGLHLFSAFIQSAVQFMPLIHPFTLTFTHQRRLAAMQGTNHLVRRNWGFGVLLRDTSTRPGWDRTGKPPTARRQLLPPEPYRPQRTVNDLRELDAFTKFGLI